MENCRYSAFKRLLKFVYSDAEWKPEAGAKRDINFLHFLEEWDFNRFGTNLFTKGAGGVVAPGGGSLEEGLRQMMKFGNPRFTDLKIIAQPSDYLGEDILEEMGDMSFKEEKEKEIETEKEREKGKGTSHKRREFRVHKFILCKRSPYFAAKFSGSMCDSQVPPSPSPLPPNLQLSAN